MIASVVRKAMNAMLARLDEPNAEVFAVFHPPGTVRVVSPAEHGARRRPARRPSGERHAK